MAETQKAKVQRALKALREARDALGGSFYIGWGTVGRVDDAIQACRHALEREWGSETKRQEAPR